VPDSGSSFHYYGASMISGEQLQALGIGIEWLNPLNDTFDRWEFQHLKNRRVSLANSHMSQITLKI